jgi:hypothetical protein
MADTLSASLRLRPTRIGFLVRPDDLPSIQKIFQLCTCLWGGVYNPIIPVCDALPEPWRDHPVLTPTGVELGRGYLRFFEPDVFAEAEDGLAECLGIAGTNIEFVQPRIMPLQQLLAPENDRESDARFGLTVFDIYQELYDREFKFVHRAEHGVAVFESNTPDAEFLAAAFGAFPLEGALAPLAQAYQDAFNPVTLAPTPENWAKVLEQQLRLPLHFSRYGLDRDAHGWHEPTLFVADPASPLDLVDLWNIRLFHPQIMPVNLSWFLDRRDFLATFIERSYRPLPGNPNGVMITPTIEFGRSIGEARAKELIETAGLTKGTEARFAWKLWYDRIWEQNREDTVIRAKRARITADARDFDVTLGETGSERSVQFASLSPDFARPHGRGSARWVNVLTLSRFGHHEELALMLPSDCPDLRMRLGSSIFVSREGFVLPQQYKDQREYLQVVTGQQAMTAWLGAHGVIATRSDPGRVADQLLKSLNGVWGSHLIADRATLRLLDEMAKSVRTYPDGRTEQYPDRAVDVNRWKELVGRRAKTRMGGRIDLDSFINAGVLRLGLALECTNCGKKNWVGLAALDEELQCERCLGTYRFPQGSLDFRRTPWQYRVVGPYSVPNYAAGAYATILALRCFGRGLGGHDAKITYATGLDLRIGAGAPIEVDFALWYQRSAFFDEEDDPVTIFGESKSFASEGFKAVDVARMRSVAEQFPGAFFAFATLKDELSATEKTLIGELALWGRDRLPDRRPRAPVIVLTGTEMFAPWYISENWKELGGAHARLVAHPSVQLDNLWTLANFTQQLYLGLPDPMPGRPQPRPTPDL